MTDDIIKTLYNEGRDKEAADLDGETGEVSFRVDRMIESLDEVLNEQT